ncbi:hypothetical protein WN51_06036 [Melipona quadrifasciata]|uniref:Uncharacterized protein n=1 Tax=Melipona quadrifasciata TaxID=166423 RepID=A0A0N0BD98_9HYME|nr:hypothetical protein WN51_06036 [Melipona quadrifasciata]
MCRLSISFERQTRALEVKLSDHESQKAKRPSWPLPSVFLSPNFFQFHGTLRLYPLLPLITLSTSSFVLGRWWQNTASDSEEFDVVKLTPRHLSTFSEVCL